MKDSHANTGPAPTKERATQQRRAAAPYDGIMGGLPVWVPDRFHHEFKATRDRLLKTDSHAELIEAIDDVIAVQGEHFANNREYTQYEFLLMRRDKDVAVLARIKEAVRLGPDAGLALLTDSGHAGLTNHGRKMREGRKPGTGGPIRKAIAKLLAKKPDMKNPELWATLKNKSPKGWQFFDNSAGKYVEGPGMANMNYERFCNVCSDERKKARAKITG